MKIIWRAFDLLFCALLLAPAARTQWQPDGTPIASGPLDQQYPAVVGDGRGGAIVLYQSGASQYGQGYTVRLQHLSSTGRLLWKDGGLPVSQGSAGPLYGFGGIVSDGASGCIVGGVYEYQPPDGSDYDQAYRLVLQRLTASGELLWGPGGTTLTPDGGGGSYFFRSYASTRDGGAVAAWLGNQLRAQKLDDLGRIQWQPGGVPVCVYRRGMTSLSVLDDGAGGAILTWADARFSPEYVTSVFAQHLDARGLPLWNADDLPVSSDTTGMYQPVPLPDGHGGAIICWIGDRTGGISWDIYAQRISAQGERLWGESGVPVIEASGQQRDFQASSDGSGGIVVIWDDYRGLPDTANYVFSTIYAQRLDSRGAQRWGREGLPVCTVHGYFPALAVDGKGRALVAWQDGRGRIYGQWIDASGAVGLAPNGVPLSPLLGKDVAVVGLPEGGGIVFWDDRRNGVDYDLFAQKVPYPFITLALPNAEPSPASFVLEQNYPNPFNSSTTIRYSLPQRSHVSLAVFNALGQELAELVNGQIDPGYHEVRFSAGNHASGLYFYRLQAGTFAQTKSLLLVR